MYAGPKHPPLPVYDDLGPSRAEEKRWAAEEIELAEFESVAGLGAGEGPETERVEREFDQMVAGEDRGLYDETGLVF